MVRAGDGHLHDISRNTVNIKRDYGKFTNCVGDHRRMAFAAACYFAETRI